MDTDFEEVSIAETLSRHRTTLEKFCKSKRLNVVEVLEEVVSGESLAARPEMMRLLELVSYQHTQKHYVIKALMWLMLLYTILFTVRYMN